jgi:HAD superfamily hydrolase (TIGR01549 family)
MSIHVAIFDVDGTLVDSNDAHARAWVEAMAENGYKVPFEKVRPLIGMGGDKVLPETVGVEKDSEQGKKISEKRKEIFQKYLPGLRAFPQAGELLQRLHDQGFVLVIATSAEPDELKQLLKIVNEHAYDLFSEESSSKDAKESKPDSDVMKVALKRSGYKADEVLMLGDTVYDIESAAKIGINTIAFRSGGWKDKDLQGAIAIYDGPADLLQHLADSPFVKNSAPAPTS